MSASSPIPTVSAAPVAVATAHTTVPGTAVEVGTVACVLTGVARPYTRAGSRSAIDKHPRIGPVAVAEQGLAGDEQGDLRVHGGLDKAVHCYPWAHYARWRAALPGQAQAQALLTQPGAFGENFSVQGPGMDEAQVCLGDVWQVGTARFVVSQGRQPCWKLNDRFGVADMARQVQRSLRTGWYLRVLQAGQVQAGDTVWRCAQPHPDWPLARLLALIDQRDCHPPLLRAALALPLLPSWHKLLQRRLETGQVEDWLPRLQGNR